MRPITLYLPDSVADVFEKMSIKQREKAACLTACLVQSNPKTLDEIFQSVDKKVAASGLTEKEIEELINEIS